MHLLAVSRSSTAPLDRLKVYLIAQTNVAEQAVADAKSGNVFRAALNAWRPLAGATKELWQAGGMRSLYAGKLLRPVAGCALTCTRQRLECHQSHARVGHKIRCIRSMYSQQIIVWGVLTFPGCQTSLCYP